MGKQHDTEKLLRKFCKHVNKAQVIEVNGRRLDFWRLEEDGGTINDTLLHAEWNDDDGLLWEVNIPVKALHPGYRPEFDPKSGRFTVIDSEERPTDVQMFKLTPIRFGGC